MPDLEVKADNWQEIEELLQDEDYQDWLAERDADLIAAMEEEAMSL